MNLSSLFSMPSKKTLEWHDVYPFLYLHAAFEGLNESKIIKHLVIDEMQDYTPIQYAVINKIFHCQKTILGDFGQFIHPNHLHNLRDLIKLYPQAEFVELKKSYRSTYEIISFAKQIQPMGEVEAIERHGDAPELIRCKNIQEELALIKNQICKFYKNNSASLGIITKTNEQAKQLYDILSKELQLHFIAPGTTKFLNGVSIVSIQMSKGLEFDEVIITDADNKNYYAEYDRSLLYIACTRAMHKLMIFYTEKMSNFLENGMVY